jgi:hypothetical protein
MVRPAERSGVGSMTERFRTATIDVRKLMATTFAGILLGAALVACSSEDPPDVCASIDDLQQSWSHLQSVDLSNATDDIKATIESLKSAVGDVKADLAQVVDDAGDQFAPEITQVKTAAQQLETQAKAVEGDASADNLAALGTAVRSFSTNMQNLVSRVADAC